jgi:hypothetical protein
MGKSVPNLTQRLTSFRQCIFFGNRVPELFCIFFAGSEKIYHINNAWGQIMPLRTSPKILVLAKGKAIMLSFLRLVFWILHVGLCVQKKSGKKRCTELHIIFVL